MKNKTKIILFVSTFIFICIILIFSILNVDLSETENNLSKFDLNQVEDSISIPFNDNTLTPSSTSNKNNNDTTNKTDNITTSINPNTKPNSDNSSTQETSNESSNSDNVSSNSSNTVTQTENSNEYIYVNLIGANNSLIGNYKIKSNKNMSTFDATKNAFDLNNIDIKSRGAGMTKYVFSINGLAEFDHGGSSGWMYKVNGSFPNKSCGIFEVKPSDKIEWVYTIDGGKDVGAR